MKICFKLIAEMKLDDTKLMREALSAYWLLFVHYFIDKREGFFLVKKKS